MKGKISQRSVATDFRRSGDVILTLSAVDCRT